jgi:hypothetical protein
VQAWINYENSEKAATATGLTPRIVCWLEHMTTVMEGHVLSQNSPKKIVKETKKAYKNFNP